MKKIILTLCLSLIWLAGCSNFENNPPVDFEKGYVNQQILLSAPSHFNEFNTKASIYLEIRYKAQDEIVLPNNLNLRIFERKAGDWIEIGEVPMVREPVGDVILAPDKKIMTTTATFPSLPDVTRRYQLRIYVSGDMKTEEGIQPVAAYVDVTLRP